MEFKRNCRRRGRAIPRFSNDRNAHLSTARPGLGRGAHRRHGRNTGKRWLHRMLSGHGTEPFRDSAVAEGTQCVAPGQRWLLPTRMVALGIIIETVGRKHLLGLPRAARPRYN